MNVININVHSTAAVHFDFFDSEILGGRVSTDEPAEVALQQVNVIMTDVGGDPFGAPGDGGFDPRIGLNNQSSTPFGLNEGEIALSPDYTFNGVGVWVDENGNGIFDPPTAAADGVGVVFNGDYPLDPLFIDQNAQWEYIPFPPGGGDPWWKLTMNLSHFRRDAEESEGTVEAVPDDVIEIEDDLELPATSISFDYFVVVRTDSGFKDVSQGVADGQGIQPGADFRAFIEPRRYDTNAQTFEGGILVSSMIPPLGLAQTEEGSLYTLWQDDSRWGFDEPWWNERTMSAASAKPLRVGLEVFDLSLTYGSNSEYARISDVSFGFPFAFPSVCFGFASGLGGQTDFDRWVDPFAIQHNRFLNLHSVGVQRFSESFIITFTIADDTETIFVQPDAAGRQYPFETVPFSSGEANELLRSTAIAQLPLQPTLADYATWPAELVPGQYPRLSDWADVDASARLLVQRTDINNAHVPLLAINAVGTADSTVNDASETFISEVNLAVWGPDFTPEDLYPLDPTGTDLNSGLLLWEDTDTDGDIFSGGTYLNVADLNAYATDGSVLFGEDRVVPLNNVRWASAPELVDLDGDSSPDDMDGNGLIDDADRAWVLTLQLSDLWPLPHNDEGGAGFINDESVFLCSFSGFGGTGSGGDGGGDGGGGGGVSDDLLYIHHGAGSQWLTSGLNDALLDKEYIDERNDIRELTDVEADNDRPDSLEPTPGNYTDIRHWLLWFNDYFDGIRDRDTASGFNQIVMFNSDAFTNQISGPGTAPGDPFSAEPTLANYKAVFQHPDGEGSNSIYTNEDGDDYHSLESIFEDNPDMLFIVMTAPPLPAGETTDAQADLAREFADWLVDTWQPAYEARNPSLNNVVVFDWFDFLARPASAGPGLRHRLKQEYERPGSTLPNLLALQDSTEFFATGPEDEDDEENSFLDVAVDEFPKIDFTLPNKFMLKGASASQLADKALDLDGAQPGGDLFVTVRVSDQASSHEQFRVVVPATLPTRPSGQQGAGIRLVPTGAASAGALTKSNPDEGPVQDFIGHDVVTMNVPLKIKDLTSLTTTVDIGGTALAALGLDMSTNEPDAIRAQGSNGLGTENNFTVSGASWTANTFVGDFLIDSRFEAYEITGNSATALTLLSGTPRDGAWKIVQNPTFLEQVVIEFYNEGNGADFDITTDLLPLNLDQRLSGVALYRDNDFHPDNRNGHFDADIDIPLSLDGTPQLVGIAGDAPQVKFAFSMPGTGFAGDDPAALPRNRQWVPQSWDAENAESDFFIVARASESMQVDDNFRMGIVSWGPNTPTEPDPYLFYLIDGPEREDYKKFQEFPWGNRGIGFITIFKDAPVRYFMDGDKPGAQEDTSGFNWVRTHSSQKKRSGIITARKEPVGPTSVVINSASTSELPAQTLEDNPFSFVIFGSGFGTKPEVILTGYTVTVNEATDTSISVTIVTNSADSPQPPIVLIVRNPDTGKEASRSNLFTLVNGTADVTPVIVRVDPAAAEKEDFPVTLIGEHFGAREDMAVLFGETLMPILSINGEGTEISLGFPTGGFATVGPMNVTVRNESNGTEAMKLNAFEFVSQPDVGKLPGCGGVTGSGGGAPLGDMVLLAFVSAALGLGLRMKGARART